jgi:hypothetical protein
LRPSIPSNLVDDGKAINNDDASLGVEGFDFGLGFLLGVLGKRESRNDDGDGEKSK